MTDRSNPLAFHQTKSSHDPKRIGLWKVGRTLGKGFSGHVRIARHSKTGQYAAIKIISKGALASRISLNRLADEVEHNLLAVEREIVVMKLIDHPNIMRLYDVWETSTSLYLILEYVQGGELFDYLCAKGRRPTSEVLGYFQQIICAVDYCHRFNIAHRDLKLENILIDQDANIKVADFGMATWQDISRGKLLRTSCGSPHYAAPEIISGKPYNGASADIWSCGVILYALLAAKLPFDDDDCPALLQKISIGRFVMPPDIDPQAQDLIWRMLTTDVRQRITMPEIMQHPFFTSQPLKNPKSMQLDPNVDSLGRPVGRLSLIDPDIFVNLRTLWHGTPDSEIIHSLMSPERNWQKGIYHLLVNYRKKYLEIRQEEEAFSEARLKGKKTKQLKRSLQIVDPLKLSVLDDNARDCVGEPPTSISQDPVCDEKPPNVPPKSPLPEYLPQITVPELDDPKIQVFFQQIADHLHVLHARSPDPNAWLGAHGVPSPNSIGVEAIPPRLLQSSNEENGGSSQSHSSEIGESGTKPLTLRRKLNKRHPAFVTDTNDKENMSGNTAPAMLTARFALSSRGATSANGHRTEIPVVPASKRSSKLQKTNRRTISPMLFSGTHSSFSLPSPPELGSSPKRSWIDNVFNFKPATFTLLSRSDVHTTRNECRRLLVEMDMLVSLEESEKLGILKCRSNDIKDASATITGTKCVKFRVELQWPTPRLFRDGYVISVLLVHEKGPYEVFKRLYQQLARDWNLDVVDKGTFSTILIDSSSTCAVGVQSD
ncbi:kinase-like protein [Phlegmacium glaucopus]|nr:kinase-like protein [Phlegmacium glaucopus]